MSRLVLDLLGGYFCTFCRIRAKLVDSGVQAVDGDTPPVRYADHSEILLNDLLNTSILDSCGYRLLLVSALPETILDG